MDQRSADIGSRLRHARETRGLTLRDIATTTKISMSSLVAIEHNDFARLPGGVFRRAYVKSFAAEVGLDPDDLAREYCATFETEPPAGPLVRHDADWTRHFRQRFPAVLATVAGISICGSVILQRDHTEEVALASHAQSLRLEIRLTGPCWVSAVADGERVVHRLMQPGERTLVEALSLITLRVGDAGAVDYSINGATGRPLGSNGEAVTVRITNENPGHLSVEPASAIPAKGAANHSRPASRARTRAKRVPDGPIIWNTATDDIRDAEHPHHGDAADIEFRSGDHEEHRVPRHVHGTSITLLTRATNRVPLVDGRRRSRWFT